MTNKEYKPLTTGGYANPKMLPQYRDRLCYLEDCIENGTLVFLPCKVGDEFWWIFQARSPFIVDEKVQSIEISERGITIIDMGGEEWSLSRVYFTKDAAEKALEELQNGKDKG